MSLQETNTEPRSSSQPITEGIRPIGGIIYGILSFITVFIITTGYFTYRIFDAAETEPDLEEVFPVPEFVGYPFYNAHRVNTPIEFNAGGGFGSQTVADGYFDLFNQLTAVGAPEFNPLVFNAIPAAILFLTGYVIAGRAGSSLSAESSAAAGASVAVGYLPLFVLGTFVLSVEDPEIVAGPELGLGLLFFGALFTVGFGGLGGYVRGNR
ncbi:hypothetical protein NP511_10010 [Natrinema thermotolerans]|uniref:DUF7978 domain-containing protein n=1 Tax=Natrinema thermotolerans TaxID=121872 RepID=A0AAF0PGI1_9EURY|nr:hypothetical protein [Natrinema thermotolerans]WMT09944.1 hypothetical protein NP511_10010 [Natrinema thermotolerans]